MPTFILEAQLIVQGECRAAFIHYGYMNVFFRSKVEAAEYYNSHNTHMRELNAYRTWASDWDRDTLLRYVVREYHSELLSIDGFHIYAKRRDTILG